MRQLQIFFTNNNITICASASAWLGRVSNVQSLIFSPFYDTIVETIVTWILLVNLNIGLFLAIFDLPCNLSILFHDLTYSTLFWQY